MRAWFAAKPPVPQPCRAAESEREKPMSHRASYWKTTVLALAGAVVCLVGLVASVMVPLPVLARGFVCVASGTGAIVLLLVVAGGLVCLWRDSRESGGREDPLARAAVKDPVRFPMRSMLGARLRPGD